MADLLECSLVSVAFAILHFTLTLYFKVKSFYVDRLIIINNSCLVSDVSQACVGGGPIVQLLCTGHDTCWLWNLHRPWPVVWSCPGSTTAMLYSTALLISCTECRTTQLGSFLRLQDDPTAAHCRGRYTGCPFSRGSTTKWLCWRSKSAAHQRRRTSFT